MWLIWRTCFIKWTTFSAKGRYFEKTEMPAQWTGLTIIIFGLMDFFDWLIMKNGDPTLSTSKIDVLLTSPSG
jgi:hypothetical protein